MTTPQEIHDAYQARLKTIDGHTEWSPQARKVAQARALSDAQTRMQALMDAEDQAVNDERQRLTRRFAGHTGGKADPAEVMSRRDAEDRAAMITSPDEARDLLRRAERVGDETLARAVAVHAAELGADPAWSRVVSAYTSTRPDAAATVAKMRELPNLNDPATRIHRAALFYVPAPGDLAGLSPHQVERLATSEDVLPQDAA